MKILVTGGAGFIGSHLCDALLEQGHEVRVLDNLSNGKEENLAQCRGRIDFLKQDIRDSSAVHSAMQGIDVCFHEAALGSVPRSIADPETSNAVNVNGTLNVLIAARDAKVKRFIFASSSSVYGDTVKLPKVETMCPRPKSPYALTKLAGEEYCRIFHGVYGLETVVLRYFNVFGPRQDPNGPYAAVIPLFTAALLNGHRPRVHGDGLQSRDFTHVVNVVHANLLAMNAPSSAAGGVYNVGANRQYTLLHLLDSIAVATGVTAEPEFCPSREGDVKHSRASYAAAKHALGYKPVMPFEKGIRLTVKAFRAGRPS